MKQIFLYTLRIWVTTAIVSPVLFFIILLIDYHYTDPHGKLILSTCKTLAIYYGIFGILLSVPGCILFMISTWLLNKTHIKTGYAKALLSSFAMVYGVISLFLFGGFLIPDGMPGTFFLFIFLFAVLLMINTWCYKLNLVKSVQSE